MKQLDFLNGTYTQMSSNQHLLVDHISAFDQCPKSKSHYDCVL